MVRNGLDLYSIQADMSARTGQESINVDATPPDNEVPGLAPAPKGNRFAFAGFGTIVFAAFFFGLMYALGQMTGESIFRKVEEAAT